MGNKPPVSRLTLERFIPLTHTDHRIGHDECLGERITSTGRWVKVDTFTPSDLGKWKLSILLVSLGNYRLIES